MKRSVVIISLILSLISFAIILLTYFGVTRHAYMYIYTMDSYVDVYKNALKDGLKDSSKIVVVIGIENEKQVRDLQMTVKSILDQTQAVDKIVLQKTKKISIPDEYKKICNIYIGKGNVLETNIKREKNSDTKILYMRSGKIYRKDFVEDMCKASNDNPISIIYTGDLDMKNLTENDLLVKPLFYKKFGKDFQMIPTSVATYKLS